MSDDLELGPTVLDTTNPGAAAGEPSHLTAAPHSVQLTMSTPPMLPAQKLDFLTDQGRCSPFI
jgi:hypothetical protein